MRKSETIDNLRNVNSATFENIYSRRRILWRNMARRNNILIREVCVDYNISSDNMTYVLGVLIAVGYDLDEKSTEEDTPYMLLFKSRYFASMYFPMVYLVADYLKTSHNIRRHYTIYTRDIEKLQTILESLEHAKLMKHFSFEEYNNKEKELRTHVIIACSDDTLDCLLKQDISLEEYDYDSSNS